MTTSSLNLMMTYYGDDFTGSTDALESLSLGGLRTMLFLQPPNAAQLARYEGIQAVGVAGISRSMTVDRMERELSAAFASLGQLGAPLLHYKVCSTFDSTPAVGSIGRAIEIGRRQLGEVAIPIVVGVPVLARYCAFGNLFARSGLDSPVFRLDRHPTMSRHPVTPMHESDLREVLRQQMSGHVGLVDLAMLDAGVDVAQTELQKCIDVGDAAVLFDTTCDTHLPIVGELIWRLSQGAGSTPRFIVGSSGVEYALTAYWHSSGIVPLAQQSHVLQRQTPIAVFSGSCSPVTARQIDVALRHGFVDLPIDAAACLERECEAMLMDLALAAIDRIRAGQSVILHTSRGPDDDRIPRMKQKLATISPLASTADVLGGVLGTLVRMLIEGTTLRRFVVTGGDTCGYVARSLNIEALELVSPVAPGGPLCRIHSIPDDPIADGLEVVLKGGQVGRDDFLVLVRDGHVVN